MIKSRSLPGKQTLFIGSVISKNGLVSRQDCARTLLKKSVVSLAIYKKEIQSNSMSVFIFKPVFITLSQCRISRSKFILYYTCNVSYNVDPEMCHRYFFFNQPVRLNIAAGGFSSLRDESIMLVMF